MTHEPKPLAPVNPQGLDDIAKSLLEETVAQRIIAPSNIQNPENYLLLEGRKHNTYQYPNMLVPIERSHLNETWNQITASLHNQGEYMLTVRQFADFLTLLRTGNACDGASKLIGKKKQEAILEDITAQRAPWRAEWLDHYYKKKGSDLYVRFHQIQQNGSLTQIEQPLEDCLMEDKQIDISDWLARANSQGLPPRNVKSGNLYFYHPRADAVARFRAGAGRVNLGCGRNPRYSFAGLGVRAAKLAR